MAEPATYEYELREGNEVIATGRITAEEPLVLGGRFVLGKHDGTVVDLQPAVGGREMRVVLETTP